MIAGLIAVVALAARIIAVGALVYGGWLLMRLSGSRIAGALYVIAGATWIPGDGAQVVAVAFGLAAIWCARDRRWGWAGILTGLGIVVDPSLVILFGVLLILALRSPSDWRRYVAGAAALMLIAVGLAAVMARIPAQGWNAQVFLVGPLIVGGLWGWPAARRGEPFLVGLAAWAALDTLIRVVLHQPFGLVAVAAGVALMAQGRYVRAAQYAMLALTGAVLILFLELGPVIHPESARITIPLEFNFPPDKATLIAYSPDLTLTGVAADSNASAGRTVRVRLTWALNPARFPQSPLSIHLTFLNRAGLPVLTIDDTVPTERWQQAQVITEHRVTMPELPPGLLSIYLTVNYQSSRLGVEPVARMIVPIGPSPITDATIARLDNGTRIVQPLITASPDRLKVRQIWISAGPLDQDYKVFLHLIDIHGDGSKAAAQYDAEPKQGDYPTSLWQPGDVIVDDGMTLDLSAVPAGDYRLDFGMYADDSRLTMTACDGQAVDSLDVAAVTIGADRSVSVRSAIAGCDLPPGARPGTPLPGSSGASSG